MGITHDDMLLPALVLGGAVAGGAGEAGLTINFVGFPPLSFSRET